MSADPLAVHAADADLNLYAYVSGAILKMVDPLGLQAVTSDQGKPPRDAGAGGVNFDPSRPDQPGSSGGSGAGRGGSSPAPNSGDGNSYNAPKGDGDGNSGSPDPNASDNGSTDGTPSGGAGNAADSTPSGNGNGKKGNGKGEWDAGSDVAALSGLGDDDLDSKSEHSSTSGNVGGLGKGPGTKLGQLAFSLGQIFQKGGGGLLKGLKWFGKGMKWLAKGAGKGIAKAWEKSSKAIRSIFSKCFPAGTLIELEGGQVPIESVGLGARVVQGGQACADLPIGGWARIDLEMQDSTGKFVGTAAVLRPDFLLDGEGVEEGAVLDLSFDELTDVDRAVVVSVSYAQEIELGSGCPITGYFRSFSSDMATVALEGEAEPLRATGGHRIYSLSREDWVGAADLEPGEWVESNEGPKVVESVHYDPFVTEPVYNLEVAALHEYRVGESGVRAHNDGPCPKIKVRNAKAGDSVRTPGTHADDFRKDGPNYVNKKTGEVWQKSHTNHSHSDGGEWKVGLKKGEAPRTSHKVTVSNGGTVVKVDK